MRNDLSRLCSRLNEEFLDISNLFKVLSFLDTENIPVKMLVDGAKEWLRSQDELEHAPSPSPSPSKPSLFQKIIWKLRGRKETNTKPRPGRVASTPRVSSEFRSSVSLILSPIQFRTAIHKLENLSLVESRTDTGSSSLWMHDLIRFTMQEGTRKEEAYREWLQSSVSLVYAAFQLIGDPELPQWWTEYEAFVPHLRTLNQQWNSMYDANLEWIRANSVIAGYLWRRGGYSEAEVLLKEVLEIDEREFGCEHPDTLSSMNNLALVYDSQGRYEDAEALHKPALALKEKNLGPDHPSTVNSMDNLALVYRSQGRYDDAEARHKGASALMEKRLGANHPSTLESTDNLALVYSMQGRYDEAEVLFKQALAGQEKHLGADHPDTQKTANHLADLYRFQGRSSEIESTPMN
jgi:tetratricopeptide (TPR) repeat protein